MRTSLWLLLLLWTSTHAQLSKEFKTHWFDGHAEISSYELIQSRYGEQRTGKAVLIYVTEDFIAKEQVKANQKSTTTLPVLKSNRTKYFLTGIYPYNIMSSTFNSLRKNHSMIKSAASIQEWCGQSYLQLNTTKEELIVRSHSYFEGEADQYLQLTNELTEDGLWNLLRFSPEQLPTGSFNILPALDFLRMNHLPLEIVAAKAVIAPGVYTLQMPSLGRELHIYFQETFPYTIDGWEETFPKKGKNYTTIAKRIHTERRQYWKENNSSSEVLRAPFKID